MKKMSIKAFVVCCMILNFAQAASQSSPTPSPESMPNVEHIQYWMQTLESNPLEMIRKQAARQLGNWPNTIAVPSLIKGLSDTNDEVRIQSAYSLGRIGDVGSLKALYELAEKNPNNQVKTAARNAIDKINAHEEFSRQRKQKLKDIESKAPNNDDN